MSHYQLYFIFTSQLSLQDHLFKTALRPLADYIIMFINGEGLKEFKKKEKEFENSLGNPSSPSNVSTHSNFEDAINSKTIHGVSQTKEGKIILQNGKEVLITDIIANLEKGKQQVDISKGTLQGVI